MKRSGYTLVELLVVLVIILVLTTLAVSAFKQNSADKINSAARLVQSTVLRARNHATSERSVRGLRFQRDANDPHVCRTIQVIGSAGQEEEGLTDIRVVTGSPSTIGDDYWVLEGPFARLGARDLLKVGTHIEVPARSGVWYVVSDREFDPDNGRISIAGHYHNSIWGDDPATAQTGEYLPKHPWDPSTGLTEEVPCRIELAPSILANDPAVVLPLGTAIDLDASKVPNSWRTLTNHCDLLFDANGGMEGDGTLVHLYVTQLSDIEMTRNLFPDHPANGGSRPVPIVPANAPNVPKDVPYLITVLKNTGGCYSSDVHFLDADSDQQADDPYKWGRMGNERK